MDTNNSYHVTCLVVVGTRPDTIKLAPVVQALKNSRILPVLVNTGQHANMVEPVLEMFGLEADYSLEVAHEGQTINSLTETIVADVDALLTSLRGGPERRSQPRLFSAAGTTSNYPALAIVHGDTTTALAAAQACSGAKVPVMHVEAGLRTGDIHSPFPEELNRQLVARIAAFHLAPTLTNEQNLIREGIDSRRIFVTGNTSLDALAYAANLEEPWADERMNKVDLWGGPIIVATAHRRENWGEGLKNIAAALAKIAKLRPDTLTVIPMHPNPAVRNHLEPKLGNLTNVLLVEPLEYVQFAKLLKKATLAITDSGGVQEEAPSLSTPVLVTRRMSERDEGVDAGTLRIVGTDRDTIVDETLRLLADPDDYYSMVSAPNPFGDGHASERIVAAMEHLIFGGSAPTPYGVGFDRRRILEAAGYSPEQVRRSISYMARTTGPN